MADRKRPRLTEPTFTSRRLRKPDPGAGWKLSKAASIDDIAIRAREVLLKDAADFLDGGGGSEISYARNLRQYQDEGGITFIPRRLRALAEPDPSVFVAGRRIPQPWIMGPTGFNALFHKEGEIPVVKTAEKHSIPWVLSMVGTKTPAELRRAAPNADLWFQLNPLRDPTGDTRLLEEMKDSGFRVLVIGVDFGAPGDRRRDKRNAFQVRVPPALFPEARGSIAQVTSQFKPDVQMQDLDRLVAQWDGPVILKGVTDPQNAIELANHFNNAIDGIVVSNHGGRQGDREAGTLQSLGMIVDALGPNRPFNLYVDGGVRSGEDIVAAILHGADAVWTGRPQLYGLAAAGEEGVDKVAELITDGIERQMRMSGISRLEDPKIRTAGLIQSPYLATSLSTPNPTHDRGFGLGRDSLLHGTTDSDARSF